MQNIDVDQILMEHYQSTSTPQPSVSCFPLRTPPVDRSSSRREEECCLPPELCSNCSHGLKVWLLLFSAFNVCLILKPIGFLILFDVGISSARALSWSLNPFGTNEERVDCNIKWTPWRWYWSESWSYSRASPRKVYIQIDFVSVFLAVEFAPFWYTILQNLLGIIQQKEIRAKEIRDNTSVSWVRVLRVSQLWVCLDFWSVLMYHNLYCC